MIYDEKKHYDLAFNQIKEPGYFSGYSMEYGYKTNEQLVRASGGKPVVKVNNLKELGAGILVLVISLITGVALHILLPCGESVIFHLAVASMFGFAGVITAASTKTYASHTYYKDRTAGLITGSLLIIEAVLIPVMWFNLPFETDWECNYFMAGIFFVVIGLYIMISLLMRLTVRLRIYTRRVDAECVGYVRCKSHSSSGGHSGNYWYHSPLFKYYLDGQEILAFYDSLIKGINAKLPMGPCSINVNKNDPGSVMNPSKKGVVAGIIIAAFLLWLGISLIRGVLNGGVQGTSIAF